MSNKLKILHLEDVEIDADLVNRILKKSQIDAEISVVDNRAAYEKALVEFVPHVILSDHSLPSFNSSEALNIFLQSGMRIPFILVTAAISEEYAVSVIKAGANDYILKNHLENLPDAIISALKKIENEINLENQKVLTFRKKTNAVLVAQEFERSQMTHELLENINQILAASNLYIDCAIIEEDKRFVFMQNSKKNILLAITEINKLSQLIMPPTLKEIGLIDSINNWIRLKQANTEMNIITGCANYKNELTSDELQLTIYRILQEQLNNTIKFSQAKNVHITLQHTNLFLELIIKDDGVGFDTSKNITGVGLQNITTRAEIHNGKVMIESAPGRGCTLKVVFPT